MSIRSEKVASTIKRILAEPVSRLGAESTKGLVTLTSVRISPDLQIAKLYVSVFGKNSSVGDAIEELENKAGELRHILSKNIRLRFTPELKFYVDDTLNEIDHIKDLLDSVKKDDNKNIID